ncbi:YtxH domain-containing protein [Chitinophaga sp. sic0106]|uniref:YtxH domain-containing protein n=1 Tax=Chitinophaga sp. sic0106 TaxID=2854785 RepID=UPI001C47D692|nr:YtxH domain-containing protein [Chitinophaga sp. sic0106]MBV7529296.1 YtxH domain-containing protein [Chitinophaga sp. sic0106]
MSTTKFLAGALAGLTAGLIIGVLTAPDSGEGTRGKIKYTAGKWRRKVNKLVGKGAGDLDELKDVFGKEVSGLSDDVREKVLRLINETKNTYHNFKKEALS